MIASAVSANTAATACDEPAGPQVDPGARVATEQGVDVQADETPPMPHRMVSQIGMLSSARSNELAEQAMMLPAMIDSDDLHVFLEVGCSP